MKKQDLKNAYGSVPTEFHNSIVRTLNTLEEEPVKTARPHSRFFRVAIACALIAAIGTVGATAAAKLYPMNATRDGNYGITLDMQPTTDDGSEAIEGMNLSLSADSNAPEYVKLNVGYLPDGVISDGFKYSLNGEHSEKCLTLVLERVGTKSTFSDTNIADFEQFEINGNVAVLAYVASNNEFDRRFYIYFEDMASFVTGYITNDYSEEEVKKIMENLTVTEGTADDHDGSALSDQVAWINGNDDLTDAKNEGIYTYYDYEYVNLGDELEYNDAESDIVFTVDNIEVLDNVSSLDRSCFGYPMEGRLDDYIDDNGNLLPYERVYYQYGDGVNSPTREAVKTDTADRRMVYATLTVKNTGSEATSIWLLPSVNMFTIGKDYGNDGVPNEPWAGEINYIDNNEADEIGYVEGYYQLSVAANSTETVHIGFLADADMLDYYYIGNYVSEKYDLQGNNTLTYKCIKVNP